MRKSIGLVVLFFISFYKTGIAQEGKWKITGKVKNETGSALSPASIFISNSTKGATTDTSGTFSVDYYKPETKTSIITLKQPVIINENGLPSNSLDVVLYGYWINSRISDLLPFDYYPEEKKNK